MLRLFTFIGFSHLKYRNAIENSVVCSRLSNSNWDTRRKKKYSCDDSKCNRLSKHERNGYMWANYYKLYVSLSLSSYFLQLQPSYYTTFTHILFVFSSLATSFLLLFFLFFLLHCFICIAHRSLHLICVWVCVFCVFRMCWA